MTVTFHDAGLNKLQRDLAELKKLKLRVGYQPPEGRQRYESGITVAKLAAVHEFGGDDTPGRSFIRSTIKERQREIGAVQEQVIAEVVRGRMTPVQAMAKIGSFVVGLIRKKLESAAGWAAPLDVETVERKGFATPLQETTLLAQSLSWRVMKAGAGEVARGNQ